MDKLYIEAQDKIIEYAVSHNIQLIESLDSRVKDKILDDVFNTFIKFTSLSIVKLFISDDEYPDILSIVKQRNVFVNTDYDDPASVCEAYWYIIGGLLLSDDYEYMCTAYRYRNRASLWPYLM